MAQWVRWKTIKYPCQLEVHKDVYDAALAKHKPASNPGIQSTVEPRLQNKDVRTLLDTVLMGTLVVLVLLSSSYTLHAGVIFLLMVVALL